jgi:hypothetical protein
MAGNRSLQGPMGPKILEVPGNGSLKSVASALTLGGDNGAVAPGAL